MFQGKRIGAILLMGGEGLRFGSATPKQFHLLGGKEIFRYALETLERSYFFDEIILVCPPLWGVKIAGMQTVIGGATRQQSSYRGIKSFTQQPDFVLIHDAVRPFVTESILENNLRQAILYGAVDTCIPSADTLVHTPDGKTIQDIPRREEYQRGQTPQTFRYDWILEAHEKALADGLENASDDCRLILRLGKPVALVKGNEQNVKITSELDLFLAEQLLKRGKRETMD